MIEHMIVQHDIDTRLSTAAYNSSLIKDGPELSVVQFSAECYF